LADGPLNLVQNGVRVAIRLTPRAKADRVVGIAAAAGDRQVVRVSVTAPAENGRANEALLQLLAREWRVARNDLAILAGFASRQKTVHVAGDPRSLKDRLEALIAAAGRRLPPGPV